MPIKAVIFDADGVVINSPAYFSVQYQKQFGISNDDMLPFFKGIFQDCVVGKADLKDVLQPYLKPWKWEGSVDEFLQFWFKTEHYIDQRVVAIIRHLRGNGIPCYLGTKQEKYRTKYIRNEMGFDQIFDKIYSSAYIGYKKPDPKFFEYIVTDLQQYSPIQPHELMFWDDDLENVQSANDVGLQAHFYTNFESFQKILKRKFINLKS